MIIMQQLSLPLPTDKEPYADMVARIQDYDGCEDLGLCSDGENHVYGVRLGDKTKPCIYINSGIHGDEWEAVYGVLHFLDCLINPDLMPDVNVRKFLKSLMLKYSFYFTPILNPYGWINDIRYTVNDIDLNRSYQLDYPENNIMKSKVAELKPILWMDNHTSTLQREFIGGGGGGNISYEAMYKSIIDSLKFTRKHNQVEWYPAEPITLKNDRGRGWVSYQPSSRGGYTMSILTESASIGTYSTFVEQATFTFNAVIMSLMHADRYFTKGILA
jgi:hypothetical protein